MAVDLSQAHAIVMILAWMVFGSTGILFARYGRSFRLGNRRQCLGKAFWFQTHRFLLSLTPLLTLLGFFFILVRSGGKWVDPQIFGLQLFIHSVFGGIIVCCVILQVWLALYRCHPRSRFRFFFDWSHRIIGLTAISLSILNIFLMAILMSTFRPKLVPTFACWTAWFVIVIIIFEKIQHKQRVAAVSPIEQGSNNANPRPNIESVGNTYIGGRYQNHIKLLLLFFHTIISIILSILLIVFICE